MGKKTEIEPVDFTDLAYDGGYPREKKHKWYGPGVRIWTLNGNNYLVGDINAMGGTCDDCSALRSGDMIVAYQRVVEES